MDIGPDNDFEARIRKGEVMNYVYNRLRPWAGDPRSQYALLQSVREGDMRTLRRIPSYDVLRIVSGAKPTFYDVASYEGFFPSRVIFHGSEGNASIAERAALFQDAVRALCDTGLCLELRINDLQMIAARGEHRPHQEWSWSRGAKQRFWKESLLALHKLGKMFYARDPSEMAGQVRKGVWSGRE